MKKYAKIVDDETKEVVVGLGTDSKRYEAMGFVVMDVERSYSGGWYVAGAVPSVQEPILFDRLRSERDVRISAVLWMRERHADELELGKETTLTPEQYPALLTYIQALRDLPAQPGAPWDGGGELTPWPELPSVE